MFLVCFSIWILVVFVGLRMKAVNNARLCALIVLQDYCSEFAENNKCLVAIHLRGEHVSMEEARVVCERFKQLSRRYRGCFAYFRKCSTWLQFLTIHKWSYNSLYPDWQEKMIRILFMEKRS